MYLTDTAMMVGGKVSICLSLKCRYSRIETENRININILYLLTLLDFWYGFKVVFPSVLMCCSYLVARSYLAVLI